MNNKKVPRKKTSAIFLAIVLIVGTFAAISPLFISGVEAQAEYRYDNNYNPKYLPYENDNINCNNINVNVNGFNGIEVGTLLTALRGLATDKAQASDEVERGASSFGSGSGSNGPVGSDNDLVYVCISNNNNNNEQPLEPTTATLKVIKQINCEDQIEGDCDDLRELVNENDYIIQVEGNNPDPSSPFPGSPIGTDITLGPGEYVVTETNGETLEEDIQTFIVTHPGRLIVSSSPLFTGDCTGTFSQATGTIAAGESPTCNVINEFRISSLPPPPPI